MNKAEWADVPICATQHQWNFRGASVEASAEIRAIKCRLDGYSKNTVGDHLQYFLPTKRPVLKATL